LVVLYFALHLRDLHSFPTRRSSDLRYLSSGVMAIPAGSLPTGMVHLTVCVFRSMALIWSLPCWVTKASVLAALKAIWLGSLASRSEEHTSELQSQSNLVCRLLLEKK